MTDPARFWDRFANRYAASPVPDEAVYRRKLEITRSYFPGEAEVLEIGCGTGTTAVAHAPHVARIRAVDVSERMLGIARGRAEEAGADNILFERAAIAELELAPESFDAVLALSILHLLPDWREAIALIHRTLRPGGVFVSSTACLGGGMRWLGLLTPLGHRLGLLPEVQFFTMDRLRGAVEAAGFEIEEDWVPEGGRVLFLVARKPAG